MTSLLLLALLALPTSPAPPCLVVEISAVGRAAHGANVARHSAPHRLIRALDELPRWTDRADDRHARIVSLEAAAAVNVIPPRASALVELTSPGAIDDGALAELGEALGGEVAIEVGDRPCTPRERR